MRERIYLSVCLKSGGPLFLSNRRLGKILKLVYNNIPGYLCIRMDSNHHTNGSRDHMNSLAYGIGMSILSRYHASEVNE